MTAEATRPIPRPVRFGRRGFGGMTNRKILINSRDDLKEGYARDILNDILDNPAAVEEVELDTLFRTLVLDDGLSVDLARSIFSAAMSVLEGNR